MYYACINKTLTKTKFLAILKRTGRLLLCHLGASGWLTDDLFFNTSSQSRRLEWFFIVPG